MQKGALTATGATPSHLSRAPDLDPSGRRRWAILSRKTR
jgi:hypothetical protein